MGSSDLKMTLDTGDEWPVSVPRAPREGMVLSGLDSFWRLFEATVDVGRRFVGAAAPSFAVPANRLIVVSELAERMRFDGPWTATSSTPHL